MDSLDFFYAGTVDFPLLKLFKPLQADASTFCDFVSLQPAGFDQLICAIEKIHG